MTGLPQQPASTEPPAVPNEAPASVRDKLYELRYAAVLEDWKLRSAARENTALATEVARQDAEQAAEVAREAAAKAAEVAREAAATATDVARQDADKAAEVALVKGLHDAYATTASASLDRALKRAEFLTATIGAVSGTYATLIALVYGVGADKTPFNGRAIAPAAFLGGALLFAAFYAAFLRRKVTDRTLLPSAVGGMLAEERLKTFMDWTFSGVLARAWALRTSIVTFGIGIALLPLPFTDVASDEGRDLVLLGVFVLIAWILGELGWAWSGRKTPYVPDPPALMGGTKDRELASRAHQGTGEGSGPESGS